MKQPACARCTRGRSKCSFQFSEENTPYSISDASSIILHENSTPTPPNEPSPTPFSWERQPPVYFTRCESISNNPLSSALAAPSNLWLKDLSELELFDHYRTLVSFSLSNISQKQQVWRFPVLREALNFEFLMHAILALAAASLMNIHPIQRPKYEAMAKSHQTIAFQLSLPYFQKLSSANCNALFAFSNIVAPLTSAFLYDSISMVRADSLDMILDFFSVLRGIHILLECASDWIKEGPLAELLNRDWSPPERKLPQDVTGVFQYLHRKNQKVNTNADDLAVYASVILLLQKAFRTYHIIAEEPGMVLIWPINVPESYIAAIKRREPLALVILAHYSVLLHSIHDCWWLEGRGAGLLKTISQALPEEWLSSVRWPLEVVHENCTDIHATLYALKV